MALPEARFSIAFPPDDTSPLLVWDPTWTPIDTAYPNLVASYTIDRGRQYELDRTDVGRATVAISDRDGILDPKNADGPFYGQIEPLLQAVIRRRDPTTGDWHTRYRGFIEELDYSFDPSQKVNRLVVSLVDIFEILTAVEMLPGEFGDAVPSGVDAAGQVWIEARQVNDWIKKVLDDAWTSTVADDFSIIFTGNVIVGSTQYQTEAAPDVLGQVYSPGESAMTAVQEGADAELPAVANVYTDVEGRLVFHGRFAKFDPETVQTEGDWDWHDLKLGDGQAVLDQPGEVAQIREFAFNRGIARVINSALATPVGIADADLEGQKTTDADSIGRFGIRSWSAQNLLTLGGLPGVDTTALQETKFFSEYYVQNYKQPRDRITAISLRSMRPGETGAGYTWHVLSVLDISDRVTIYVGAPAGVGFTAERFFVEGVHEEVKPLNADYDDVTMRLDLSPEAYWTDNPFT